MRDVLLSLVPMVFVLASTTTAEHFQPDKHPLDLPGYLWLAAAAMPLLLCRRFPLSAFVLVTALTWAYYWSPYPGGPAVVLPAIALFTVTRLRGPLLAGLVGTGALLAVLVVYLIRGHMVFDTRIALSVVGLTAVIGIGTAVRNRVSAVRASREQAAERQHRLAERERLRIAREVHDVVAHSLAMINVQAGVAAHFADRRPEQAVEALRAIKEASAVALADLRATVAVLRTGQGLGPAPSLRQLDELLEHTRATGLEVRVHGSPGVLPAPVDGAAYRILQESLTNVVRHANRASTVDVYFGRTTADLVLVVRDNGREATEPSPGHGLRGMCERAAALGGRLDVQVVDGGFEIRTRLPVCRDEDGSPVAGAIGQA